MQLTIFTEQHDVHIRKNIFSLFTFTSPTEIMQSYHAEEHL